MLNSIMHGDCLELMAQVKQAELAPDLIFADPPFNIGYQYDQYDDKRSDDDYLNWSREWIATAADLLSDRGSLWIAIGDEYVAELKMIADQAGLQLRNWIVWYYTFGVHCSHKYTRSHTHILYFVKNSKQFIFHDEAIRVPSARQLVYNDNRANSVGRVPDNTWILRPHDIGSDWTDDHDTWYVPRIAGTFKQRAGFHGCQMPERLLGRIVLSASDADSLVLDPFSGSGVTAIVAKKLGRDFIGLEMSDEYVAHSRARLDAVRVGDELDGPEDPFSSGPTSVKRKQPRANPQHDQAIADAFAESSDGYSSDRVIADPQLNAAFVDACSRRSLSGRPVDWNRRLLALRKAQKLDVATTRTDRCTWEQLDPFLFASEIALRQMLNAGFASIDDFLCDPRGAIQFDEIARSLAPGFSSFQYRWAALWLRKQSRVWRQDAASFTGSSLSPDVRYSLADAVQITADHPAVYEIRSAGKKHEQLAYIGATLHLGEQMARTAAAVTQFARFLPKSGSWTVDLYKTVSSNPHDLRALHSTLITAQRPPFNFLDLGNLPGSATSVTI